MPQRDTHTELTPELLVSAYAQGIFPMEIQGELCWLSPPHRAIIELDGFHVPRSLRQVVRQQRFTVSVNSAFADVLQACTDRPEGTWINAEIVDAYTRLYELGLAHSVETYQDGRLVGGLYGVALGGGFFGESMFHRARDASKVALVHLVERLRERAFHFLDVQFTTPHLKRFGAHEIPRREYHRRLRAALQASCRFAD